jgi:hypothetical protein
MKWIKMNKLKLFTILIVILTLVQNLESQNPQLVSKFERVSDLEDYTLRISFHSWGEGRTTELNLDQYFPIKRDKNSRYVFVAPPEISVTVDQIQGIANLKAFENWAGTKEVIFSLTDVFRLETAITNLQVYKDVITQQRAPSKLKQQFEDLPAYHLFEKILDNLEEEVTPLLKVEVVRSGNNIQVEIGDETKLELDLQTLTKDNLKTLKPKIGIEIEPEQKRGVEEEPGLSFFIFIPLILIVLTLLTMGAFYVKNNSEKFKGYFKKEKPKPTPRSRLISHKRRLTEVSNRLRFQSTEKSVDQTFEIIKDFFNAVTPKTYQFSYSEIKKDLLEDDLSTSLKDKLQKFSVDVSDTRFKGETITPRSLKKIISRSQKLIAQATKEEQGIIITDEKERLSKTLPIKTIKYVLDSFKEDSTSAKKVQESFNLKNLPRKIFHKLGILQTLAERELKRKRKFRLRLRKIKDKERQLELARKRRKDEKNRKKLLKLKTKQQKEHLRWLEAQRKIREIQKRQDEKRKRKLARAKAIRNYFHDKFGLFKTVKDIEKELETKRKYKLAKEREKRSKRRQKRQAVLNFFHFLRLYKTPEEKHQEDLILQKEDRLKKQQKQRRKEARRQARLEFLHSLKLYRTPEEVEQEKDKRLRKLRAKQKEAERKFQEKEEERRLKRQEKQKKRLHKLKEQQRQRQLRILEKARKTRHKELAEIKRKEALDRKKRELIKFLHDKLGLLQTPEERERKREHNFREKIKKQKHKELEKLQALKEKQRNQAIKRKEKEEKKKLQLELQRKKNVVNLKEKNFKRNIRQQKFREFQKGLHKSLHDNFGLFKTDQEKQKIKHEKDLKDEKEKLEYKAKKAKKQELKRQKEIKKQKADLEAKKLRRQKYLERKRALRKFLHDHFGLYKTKEDLQKQKTKISRDLHKEEAKKKQRHLKNIERKRRFRTFLHDKLGFFKSREEIQLSHRERHEHRIELEHKLEDTVLKALASRLERKKLTPEQEIKILMQLEQEALRHGDTNKSKQLQARINKAYKKVKKSRPHPSLVLNKLRNSLESVRDYMFSTTTKLDSLSPFIKKVNNIVRISLSPQLENAKIDQVNYLINKAEIQLRRNKKPEAKEFYQRAVHLYKSMNKTSKRSTLPTLLKIKNEITSTAVSDSLEKAFSAIYTGQVKRAKKLYKNIDTNFMNLPTHEREKLYDQKEQLYQQLKEKTTSSKPKLSFKAILKKLFKSKEKRTNFFPFERESRFQPRPIKQKVETPIPEKSFIKKESFTDYLTAKKPKFPSIRTEIINKKHERSALNRLLNHVKKAEHHVTKNNHEKAHHNYRLAINIFKDTNLTPDIRDNIYKNLESIKGKILHISLNNFFKKTKDSLKKDEIETARKFHQSLEGIYTHLHHKKAQEIKSALKQRGIGVKIDSISTLDRNINQARNELKKGNSKKAFSIYQLVNNNYNNLKPHEKKEIYPRLSALYSELLRKSK